MRIPKGKGVPLVRSAKKAATPPALRPPPKRTYKKDALKDPTSFGISFGDTGLRETPSIIGMDFGLRPKR